MTPEERAELERELAAELEALPQEEVAEEDELPTHQELTREYVRLDIAVVLQDAAKSVEQAEAKTTSRSVDGSTWSKLMESVAHCNTVVFGAFDLEMEELQTQFLPNMKALTSSVDLKRQGEALRVPEAGQQREGQVKVEAVALGSDAVVESRRDRVVAEDTTATEESVDGGPINDTSVTASDGKRDPVQIVASVQADVLLAEVAVTPTPEETCEAPQQLIAQHDDIESQDSGQGDLHAEGESVRLKTQLHAQRAQQELEAMMASMASQWELEQSQRELQRREAAMERESRAMMAREENRTRLYIEAGRVAGEVILMQQEDALAQCVEALLASELQRQAAERQQMTQEEARTWRHLRQQRETQRKEKLVEEHSRLRRWHHRVMEEMVCTIAARAEAKRRAEDMERRRVQRELSAMRSEEHRMRRVEVQERVLRDEQRRHEDRMRMEVEDALARRIRYEERQKDEMNRERDECVGMGEEDQRSREWETLWRLRIKQLHKWHAGKPWRDVKLYWNHWRRVVAEEQERELEEKEELSRLEAALTIGCCLLRYIKRRRAARSREAHEAHTEATQAAKVVQSAFRGFHVRRKFQNALEMAKTMDFDGDIEFGEVNLDDLIQAPPELDEDWETPTMSAYQPRRTEPVLPCEDDGDEREDEEEDEDAGVEEEEEEDDDDEETVRERRSIPEAILEGRVATPKRNQQAGQPAEGGGNLAAQLWNRMRSKTLKRQHVQEEKKRQQDPEYRAKKVLGKASHAANAHSNNQQQQQLAQATTVSTTVTWATNTDKKKAPKVKLPSLVERLRKKTAATR